MRGCFKKRTERTNTGQLAWLVGDRAGRERLEIQVHYQPQHLLTARWALITWGRRTSIGPVIWPSALQLGEVAELMEPDTKQQPILGPWSTLLNTQVFKLFTRVSHTMVSIRHV